MGAGTHGSIKGYRYNVSKYELEKAVHHVISTNAAIVQDSVRDYYNNDTNYISIDIIQGRFRYEYVIHYYGNKQYWDTSATSCIAIVYGYDYNHDGGSAGNGGLKWYNFSLKKRITNPFEQELVHKIDSMLRQKYREE